MNPRGQASSIAGLDGTYDPFARIEHEHARNGLNSAESGCILVYINIALVDRE